MVIIVFPCVLGAVGAIPEVKGDIRLNSLENNSGIKIESEEVEQGIDLKSSGISDTFPIEEDACQSLKTYLESLGSEVIFWDLDDWVTFFKSKYNVSEDSYEKLDYKAKNALLSHAQKMVDYYDGLCTLEEVVEFFSSSHNSGYIFSAWNWQKFPAIVPKYKSGLHKADILYYSDQLFMVKFLAEAINYDWIWSDEVITQIHPYIRGDKLASHNDNDGYQTQGGLFNAPGYPGTTTNVNYEPLIPQSGWVPMLIKGSWAGQVYQESWKGTGDMMIMTAIVSGIEPQIQVEMLFQVVYRFKHWYETFYRYRVTNNYIYKSFEPIFWFTWKYSNINIVDDDSNSPWLFYSNAEHWSNNPLESNIIMGDVPFQLDAQFFDYLNLNDPVQACIRHRFRSFQNPNFGNWVDRGFVWWQSSTGWRVFACDIPTGPNTYGYHEVQFIVWDNDQDHHQDGITNPVLTWDQTDELSCDRKYAVHTFYFEKYSTDITLDVSIVPAKWSDEYYPRWWGNPKNTETRLLNYSENTDPAAKVGYGDKFLLKFKVSYPSDFDILIEKITFEIVGTPPEGLGTSRVCDVSYEFEGTGGSGGTIDEYFYFQEPYHLGGVRNSTFKITTQYYDYKGEGYWNFDTDWEGPPAQIDELNIWNYFDDDPNWNAGNQPLTGAQAENNFDIRAKEVHYRLKPRGSTEYGERLYAGGNYATHKFEVSQEKLDAVEVMEDQKPLWAEIVALESNLWYKLCGWFWKGYLVLQGKLDCKQHFGINRDIARDPYDFQYDYVYQPSFDYSSIPIITEDVDPILKDLFLENARNYIELMEYQIASYVTLNRLITAEDYAPEYLELQSNALDEFNDHIKNLELEINMIDLKIYERDEELNPDYNIVDYFQETTLEDYLNFAIEHQDDMYEPEMIGETLDPELKEELYEQLHSFISNPPSELDKSLYEASIGREISSSFTDVFADMQSEIMQYPDNNDSPQIDNLVYSEVVPYDTLSSISFSVSDSDGIKDIQGLGTKISDLNINYDENTNEVLVSFKLLKYGQNVITLVITDNHPNNAKTTYQKIVFFVDDGNVPQISLVERSLDPIYDSTLNSKFTFLITDATLTNVIVNENDVEIFSGLKYDLSVELPSKSGIYEYEIFATDALGNINNHMFTVEIIDDDTTPPTVEFNPNFDLSDGELFDLSDRIEVNVLDLLGENDVSASGISSIEYTIDSGSPVSIELSDSPLQHSFYINVPNELGQHSIQIKAVDSDSEHENDQQICSEDYIFTVYDDDVSVPEFVSIVAPMEVGVSDSTFCIDLELFDYSGIYKIECVIKLLDGTEEQYLVFTDFDIPSGDTFMKSYIFQMETAEYSLYEKEFEVIFVATDNDRDRLADYSSSDPVSLTIISDDDLDPPVLTIDALDCISDGNPGNWRIVVEDESGIHEIGLIIDGMDYIFTQSDFGTGMLVELLIPINNEYGEHTCEGYAIDADIDRGFIDQLDTIHPLVSCIIYDDDIIAPEISYVYDGDSTDGNPGTITFTATDASGIAGEDTLTYVVPSELGTYEFSFTVEDADNDRAEDSLSTTLTVPITIEDDDTSPPLILNPIIQDEIYYIQFSFDVLEDNSGDDEGVSQIIIHINGEIILIYEPPDPGLSFNFIIPNAWAMNIGPHTILIEVWDADNDRAEDSSYTFETGVFFITFEEMKDYVIWEINQFIIAIQDSPDELWGDPVNQRKNAMINKLFSLRELVLSDLFEDAYDKLLHDLKPLLTGLKTDENNVDWGNGVFKNAWVIYEDFEIRCNEILSHLQILLVENT